MARHNENAVKSAQFKIFSDENEVEEVLDTVEAVENETTVYTVRGKEDVLNEDGYPLLVGENADQDILAFAKKVVSNGCSTYYVKTNDNGTLYNPIGMYSEGNHKKYNKRKGRSELQWKTVKETSFNLYLEFLRTRNVKHLTQADREVI